jgi:hypothetical protein
VGECFDFEFDEDVAFEDAVIEYQVYEAVVAANENALLPRLETEAVTEFEKEFLEFVEQNVLQISLSHNVLWLEAQKLEDVGVAHGEPWLYLLRGGMGNLGEGVFVLREAGAFVVQAADLAFEFAYGPVASDTLRFRRRRAGGDRQWE